MLKHTLRTKGCRLKKSQALSIGGSALLGGGVELGARAGLVADLGSSALAMATQRNVGGVAEKLGGEHLASRGFWGQMPEARKGLGNKEGERIANVAAKAENPQIEKMTEIIEGFLGKDYKFIKNKSKPLKIPRTHN